MYLTCVTMNLFDFCSASIGQVHKAKLTSKYGGYTVAVKVMHPNAEDLFRNDLKVFRTLCKVALPGWEPILREFETQIMTEFDYGNEANNLRLEGEHGKVALREQGARARADD
jgi:predicted unusual protein kinase regulating ubiquinone biosynthesis (AarF/ABC1/UbiB family)